MQYIDLYNQCHEMIKAHSCEPMNSVRDMAFEHYKRQGMPTRKVERYKYTDVAKAFSHDYGLNLSRVSFPVNPQDAFKCDVPNLSTQLYFVENDEVMGDGCDTSSLIVCSLKKASERYPELVKKHYARLADSAKDPITAFNTAFAQDGLFIYVSRNTRIEKPLQIVNLLRSDVDMMVNRRVLIVLEEGADATILFCDHAMDRVQFLTTQVMEVCCADNSRLDMYELEETHTNCKRFSNLNIEAGRYCRVSHNNITLFNGLTRNTTEVALCGEGAELTLNGAVVADKSQQVDNNTLIDHRVPNCVSNQRYKYVIDEQAVGAFAGRILVEKDAQKTLSTETNANLCASADARMYTQPMLEIYADDVKCAHGSTVGVLDSNALFYMQQRGIPLEEARMLLMFAFVGQVIDQVTLEPLRDRLHHLVEKRFRGELNKCTGCALCK